MDYTPVRISIRTKLMEITTAWNMKNSVFPVMPRDLTEKQKIVWDIMTKSSTIGSLSVMQSNAFRDLASEMLGTALVVLDPERRIDLTTVTPYVVLTAQRSDSFRTITGGADSMPVMRKATGDWMSPLGKSAPVIQTYASYVRLPTLEELDQILAAIPDEFLSTVFSGILPLKFNKEQQAEMLAVVKQVTEDLFMLKPVVDIEAKTAILYRKCRPMDKDTRDIVFYAADLTWDDAVAKKVKELDEKSLSVPPLSCLTVKGKTHIHINAKKYLTKKEVEDYDDIINWPDVECPTDEQIEKAFKDSNIKYLYAMMPTEFRTKIMEEVKLE